MDINYNKDYYKILDIEENATENEIKKKFRSLSLKYHPDRNNSSEESTKKFQEINEAYTILGNKENRVNYEQMRKYGFGNSNLNINADDIFSSLFSGLNNFSNINNSNVNEMPFGNPNIRIFTNGFQSNFSDMIKPKCINKNIVITLKQAYTGCSVPINIDRICIDGNFKQNEIETCYINIKSGIDNNEIIILKEKGNIINNKKGDVKIFIKISNDSHFNRDGLNLYYKKLISLREALCGFTFEFEFLNGKKFKINNNKGNVIKPNFKKEVPNMGMIRDNKFGNLYIEFIIVFPDSLENKSIELLESILE